MTDHIPHAPRSSVRVAETTYENEYAKIQFALAEAKRGLTSLDDETLVALLEEPEFYVELTPLERELTVRLGVLLEVASIFE
jgi:hypothetical protein